MATSPAMPAAPHVSLDNTSRDRGTMASSPAEPAAPPVRHVPLDTTSRGRGGRGRGNMASSPAEPGKPTTRPVSLAAARHVSLQPIRPPRPAAVDFSAFRTKSSLSKPPTPSLPVHHSGPLPSRVADDDVPVGRYFAALRGPELDHLRAHEDSLLPQDATWPFLLRFPVNSFGISLGLSSQAILWSSLSSFLHVSPIANVSIWFLAVASLLTVSTVYLLKCVFFFEAVRREFMHPVRVNFFFAPWVVCMFLAISAPRAVYGAPHPAVWCVFMAPVLFLELKIYGQWLSGGKRRLCKVANPSSHLSVVGNFVGAILAVRVGWAEPAKFLWAVGLAHYLVVFVTLYQRLPTSEALPKELHPVYSMFIAAPSAASIAWANIYGSFDEVSRTCYFIALFLYISLVVRINFFRGFRFSMAWWSYTFPMTTASVATIKYAEEVRSPITKAMALALSLMSSAMVLVLFVSTFLHAFLWKTLFPNDLAIAITKDKAISARKKGGTGKKKGGPQIMPSIETKKEGLEV